MAIDPFFGSVLAAGTSLIGGALNRSAIEDANERASNEAALNRRAQDEFMRRGLTIRAEDAMHAYKLTGIHPLAMLGVQGPTYTPVSTTFQPASLGAGLAQAGQDISRGIHATADRELRREALVLQMHQLRHAAERGGLENELLRTQIASSQARMSNSPAMPGGAALIPGQGSAPVMVKDEPLKRTVADIDPSAEPGPVTSRGWLVNADGSMSPVKSKDAQERLEDDFWGNTKHFITNTVVPMFDPGGSKAPYPAPPGKVWYVDWKGDWRLIDDKYRGRLTGHPSERPPYRAWYR